MAESELKRYSVGEIVVDTNLRCLRVYPSPETKREVGDIKTVGVKLSRDQAIHLARVLLVGAQDWDVMELTAYRHEQRREDGTFRLTVTNRLKVADDPS